ncbi:DUF2793 domain-containing protein [Fibrella sp. WM1]|uniref:DUF2793 domain-containing protein n=1 Tax=Fibrella musci TaxID=3242485 RepID=UPI00352018A7
MGWQTITNPVTGEQTTVKFNDTTIQDLPTVASLSTFKRNDSLSVLVKDTQRGGLFTYASTGFTVDNGNVFPALGGGYWVRLPETFIDPVKFGLSTAAADNTAAMQAAVNVAQILNKKVVVPGGIYLFLNTVAVPVGVVIELDAKCTLKLNTTAVNLVLLRMQSNTALRGGTVQGLYDKAKDEAQPMTLNGVTTGKATIPGCNLIEVRQSVSTIQPVTDVLIDGVSFVNAYSDAVDVWYQAERVTINNCRFENNYAHLIVRGGSAAEPGNLSKNITITNNYFGYSHHTHTSANADYGGTIGNAVYPGGGNALTTHGGIWYLNVSNNFFGDCGRRSFEGYPNDVSNPAYTRDQQRYGAIRYATINSNVFLDAVARTFTLFVVDSSISGNTIIQQKGSIEATWINTKFTNNHVEMAAGLDDSRGYSGSTIGDYMAIFNTLSGTAGNNCVYSDNTFIIGKYYADNSIAPVGGAGFALKINASSGWQFVRNRVTVYGQLSASVVMSFCCSDFKIADNIVAYRQTVGLASSFMQEFYCRNFDVSGNKVTVYDDNAAAVGLPKLAYIGACENARFVDNLFEIRGPALITSNNYSFIELYNNTPADSRYQVLTYAANGIDYTLKPIKGVANVPPGSNAIDDVYIVGELAATGAWAGQENRLATWTGSSWNFTIPNDLIWARFGDHNTIAEDSFLRTYHADPVYSQRLDLRKGNPVQNPSFGLANNVYVVGTGWRNLTVARNNFEFNIPSGTFPTRMVNGFSWGSQTQPFVLASLTIEDNTIFPTLDSRGNITFLGVNKFKLPDIPLARLNNIAGQFKLVKGAYVDVRTTGHGQPTRYVCNGSAFVPVAAAYLTTTASYTPGTLATASVVNTTVTVAGATVGQFVEVTFNNPLQGCRLWGEVTAANTVTVYVRNDTGASVTLNVGTLTIRVD